jgi:hypothetical protein
MNVPARYCTGYLGNIGVPPDPAPMDFSAWFEAYLGGRWYTFNARHNTPRIGRILMARGRDAADVAILTSFAPGKLAGFKAPKRSPRLLLRVRNRRLFRRRADPHPSGGGHRGGAQAFGRHHRLRPVALFSISAGVVFYGLLALFPVTALVSCYGLFAKPGSINDHLSWRYAR